MAVGERTHARTHARFKRFSLRRTTNDEKPRQLDNDLTCYWTTTKLVVVCVFEDSTSPNTRTHARTHSLRQAGSQSLIDVIVADVISSVVRLHQPPQQNR